MSWTMSWQFWAVRKTKGSAAVEVGATTLITEKKTTQPAQLFCRWSCAGSFTLQIPLNWANEIELSVPWIVWVLLRYAEIKQVNKLLRKGCEVYEQPLLNFQTYDKEKEFHWVKCQE